MSQENQEIQETQNTEEISGNKISQLLSKIKIWNDLDPKQKTKVSVTVISVVLILLSIGAYKARQSGTSEKVTKKTAIEKKDIRLDSAMAEKSFQAIIMDENKKRDEEIARIYKQLEEVKGRNTGEISSFNDSSSNDSISSGDDINNDLPQPPQARNKKNNGKNIPLPPANLSGEPMNNAQVDEAFRNSGLTAPIGSSPNYIPPPQPVLIGEIESNPVNTEDYKKKNTSSADKKMIYLPPSFVEATLLSGATAKTSGRGSSDPTPLLFRIKNLAILPNNVKANIKGCFVIAEGKGDLSDERVHTRLITLSCVTKKGESVIDQAVKGWVEDNADGKVGLKGEVVAKMGTTIARTALAGFVGGFGSALGNSTMTSGLSVNGVPMSAYTGSGMSDYTKAGAGEGIKEASEGIKEVYLDLVKQTVPVVEILPSKEVTLVFSEGVNLEIKDITMKNIKENN